MSNAKGAGFFRGARVFLIGMVIANGCFVTSTHAEDTIALHPLNAATPLKNLSLDFQDISVRAALQIIARFAGINIVVSDSVTGHITLNLHELPWQQAIDIILETRGLAKRDIGNVLVIAPQAEILKQKQQILAAERQYTDAEPLHAEFVQINYGKAEEIANLIKNQSGALFSSRGSIGADARTNRIWVQDVPEKLSQLKRFMRALDAPIKQVMIEARIVNLDRRFERELGIRWGATDASHFQTGFDEQGEHASAKTLLTQRLNMDLPTPDGIAASGAAMMGLLLTKLGDNVLLDLELSALESEGQAKVIANPRLMTANQKEAIIEAGEEIPYQEARARGATAVAFKKAVLSLRVTPQITPDHRVILDLNVIQDKRSSELLLGVPAIDTREIHTQVLVDDGQTVVLGGIYQKQTSHHIERIPLLGALPIVGSLFKHSQQEDKLTELLIFVTPKIVQQHELVK